MAMLVVDDQLLLAYLSGEFPSSIQGDLATTYSWWWRLLRSAERPGPHGLLSRRFADLGAEGAEVARMLVRKLPRDIRTLDLRSQLPAAARVAEADGLNLLAAEAIAAALFFSAGIRVAASNDGPRLRAAAASRGVDYQTVQF